MGVMESAPPVDTMLCSVLIREAVVIGAVMNCTVPSLATLPCDMLATTAWYMFAGTGTVIMPPTEMGNAAQSKEL